jgi:hypothetical protein
MTEEDPTRAQAPPPPAPQSAAPQNYAPYSYADEQQPGHSHGWLVAVGLVLALAVGGLAAAIISKGDDKGTNATVPAQTAPATVIKQTTTTVTAPATNVTVAPNVTLAPDGTPSSKGAGTTATSTTQGTTTGTTTSP